MHRLRHARCAAALRAVLFFTAAAFLLLSFCTESFDAGALLLGAIVSGVILLSYCLLSWLARLAWWFNTASNRKQQRAN